MSHPAPAAPAMPAAGPLVDGRALRQRALMLLLALLVGLDFLENGMFVFAASHIAGGVDAGPREFAQAQAIYAMGTMLTIAAQQWLTRHFGYRRYLAGSLLLFMAGALAAARADSVGALGAARAVQGLGAGALFTSSRILVQMSFAPAQRLSAVRHFMVGAFGASAVAPLLAATMVDRWGWQWVFLAALPVALLALAGVLVLLPRQIGLGSMPVRWAAGPLLWFAAAVGCVQWALSDARYAVFDHPARLLLMVALGALLIGAFVVHQWSHDEPLLRLRELRHPAFVTGLGLYFLYYLLSNFSGYLFPVFAERGLGLPLLTTGWLNGLAGAVGVVVAWIYTRIGGRVARKKPVVIAGALGLALMGWLFASLPPDAPVTALWAGVAIKGLFGVLMVLPVAGVTFRSLGEAQFAHGYQSKNLMRQLAGSFATATGAIMLQDRQFAVASELGARVNAGNPWALQWLDHVQAALAAHGLPSAEAHAGALAELARLLERQALVLACEQLYLGLAVLALVTAAAVALQRQLR
ncbi:MFS transporter [Ottowia sp.]|uniref:MFS transporter n=1 Tax=Ottowia sp. TaxID=1898956 RepID=UPI002634A076|nr:MFS transporter [Ottowia sp.]